MRLRGVKEGVLISCVKCALGERGGGYKNPISPAHVLNDAPALRDSTSCEPRPSRTLDQLHSLVRVKLRECGSDEITKEGSIRHPWSPLKNIARVNIFRDSVRAMRND